jgi:hypothetical protein
MKPEDLTSQPPSPGEQAWAAFQREYTQLAREHFGQWVAYQGGRRVAVATSKTEAYQACFRQGLGRGEFVVFCVEPAVDELYLGPSAME